MVSFEETLNRVQAMGITADLAKRLLGPFTSTAIHEAERHALEFIGEPADASPASLFAWLESGHTNALMARGMLQSFIDNPEIPIALTPSIYISIGIAAQVYVYAHRHSRVIVPDHRAADLRKIVGDPSIVYAIDPYYFEEIVAFVYELMGLRAIVTSRSGDKGADVLVWHPSGISESPLKAVQVKRYNPSLRVGIAEIQRMKGVVIDFQARAGEIVTTSWFTSPARLSAARQPLPIELTDFHRFTEKLYAALDP
jgi:hypothetical protein